KTFTLNHNANASTVTVAGGTLIVNDGKTLAGNAGATAVTLNTGGTIKVGTTAVNGTIDGDSAGHGTLEITGTETSNGAIGSNFPLSYTTLFRAKTFTLNHNANASTVTVAGGTLVVNDGKTLSGNGGATAV